MNYSPPYKIETMREFLTREGPQDWDVVAHALGVQLGLVNPNLSFQVDVKWIFHSNNPLGNALYHLVHKMVEDKMLVEVIPYVVDYEAETASGTLGWGNLEHNEDLEP